MADPAAREIAVEQTRKLLERIITRYFAPIGTHLSEPTNLLTIQRSGYGREFRDSIFRQCRKIMNYMGVDIQMVPLGGAGAGAAAAAAPAAAAAAEPPLFLHPAGSYEGHPIGGPAGGENFEMAGASQAEINAAFLAKYPTYESWQANTNRPLLNENRAQRVWGKAKKVGPLNAYFKPTGAGAGSTNGFGGRRKTKRYTRKAKRS